jgi:DNA-binding response OmpR family regulator
MNDTPLDVLADTLDDDTQLLRPVVCLIEDDPDLRAALAASLRAAGYAVREASDGSQVIGNWATIGTDVGELIDADLIITDQRMPGASGLEVLSDVRRRDWATQVVIISAFVDDELKEKAHRLGAAAVLAKPFGMEELIDAVENAVPL